MNPPAVPAVLWKKAMRLQPHWMIAALAPLAAALPLAGQAPADRAALERLRDSLATLGDSTALRRLEAATIEVAKGDRDNPLIHLRLGFIAYRLGEVSGSKSHYDDAGGEFEWAAELRPDWPYPWYGLGIAELAQGENRVIAFENLRQQLGIDYLSKAAQAFARATRADPRFAAAAVDLANAALAQRVRPQLDVAVQALRLAAGSGAATVPEVALAWGRVERAAGEVDSAVTAFRAYLAAGGDSGVGCFELARTRFLAKQAERAERDYYRGARAARSVAALQLYRTDLSYLVDSAELARFDAVPAGAARAEWLRRFWGRRDVAEARDPGERLAEHNRRWAYALHNFRLVSRHRHYDIVEVYRSDQRLLDDRGLIYIRHGQPDGRAVYVTTGEGVVEPNESWVYRRPTGNLVFHFVSRGDVQDYKLVESALDALGFEARFQAGSGLPSVAADLWQSRADLDPIYARWPSRPRLVDERSEGQRAIAIGMSTDSYARHYERALHPVVSDFVAGAEAATPDLARGGGGDGVAADPSPEGPGQALHVVLAIPAARLLAVAGSTAVLYPLHFRLLVATPAESLVARLDTVRTFTAPQLLRTSSFLSAQLALPLPPGRYRYHLLIETADGRAGQVVERDSLAVPRLDGRQFAASDVVLGRAGAGLVWPRTRPDGGAGVDTVLLAPLRRFPKDSVVELYYELYGLAPGAPYHTEIEVERIGGRSLFRRVTGLFGRGRPPVRLAFDAPAAGAMTPVHRGVSLRGLGPGRYRLTVTLSDPASGAVSRRSDELQVVDAP